MKSYVLNNRFKVFYGCFMLFQNDHCYTFKTIYVLFWFVCHFSIYFKFEIINKYIPFNVDHSYPKIILDLMETNFNAYILNYLTCIQPSSRVYRGISKNFFWSDHYLFAGPYMHFLWCQYRSTQIEKIVLPVPFTNILHSITYFKKSNLFRVSGTVITAYRRLADSFD